MERSRHPAIELRHLRYFLAVFEDLHFGRAAERLHIAQPPLSQAIRKLEDELGVELLRRTSRVVTATEAGHLFAEHARKVLASLDLAVAEARRAGAVGTPLRIGCARHIPVPQLEGFLGLLREHRPQLLTEVTNLLALEQVRRLRDGELDLGIVPYAEDYEGIELEPLFPGESLVVVLPPDHRLAAKDVLGPDDLRDEVLVMFPRVANPGLYDRLLGLYEGVGYRFRGLRETDGTDARDLLLAVAAGYGVALVTFPILESTGAAPSVIWRSLQAPLSMPDAMLAWRATPPRGLQPLLEAAREAARTLRQGTDAFARAGDQH
jgi:DNA-binding transcriptional LysR family regulator